MAGFTRRELLQAAGGVALARCVGAPEVQQSTLVVEASTPLTQALPQDDEAFPLGVLAGDATATSIILCTRYNGRGRLTLRIWEELPELQRTWFEAQVQPTSEGFVHLDIADLGSSRAYRYAFVVDDASRSRIGNFKTAPDADASPIITFGGTCCTRQRCWPWPVLSHAAGRDLAFFVHNGDQVYADAAKSQAQYRAVYQENYQQAGLMAVHQAFTFYATWDDHEFDQTYDPETFPEERFRAAQSTFLESLPIRRHPDQPDRIWRSYRWGKTLELFLLDTRTERKPSTRQSRDACYLSRAQMDWLKQGLASSPCAFKFVVNSVPIASFGGLFDVMVHDRWEGYPAQRDELLSFVVNETKGVWFCSGDFHLGAIGRAEESGAYSGVRELLWGPGGQLINLLHSALNRRQWDFVIDENNYTMLTCDPNDGTLRLRYVNEKGADLVDVTYTNATS